MIQVLRFLWSSPSDLATHSQRLRVEAAQLARDGQYLVAAIAASIAPSAALPALHQPAVLAVSEGAGGEEEAGEGAEGFCVRAEAAARARARAAQVAWQQSLAAVYICMYM